MGLCKQRIYGPVRVVVWVSGKARLVCAVSVALFPITTLCIALAQTNPADLTKLSIEDLMEVKIESVSKFEQRLAEVPASVSIITSDDIKKYGYRNLIDILQSIRGLYGRYDRNYHYLGLRGFS